MGVTTCVSASFVLRGGYGKREIGEMFDEWAAELDDRFVSYELVPACGLRIEIPEPRSRHRSLSPSHPKQQAP
jgi:hypothetical protein